MHHSSPPASPLVAAGLLAALLPLGACGGGDGTAEPAVALSFSAAELQVEEDAGTVAIEVVLKAPPEGLSKDVSVVVSDLGTGTATPGADYVAIPAQQLLFPAGSGDGSVQTVEVTLLADSLVEGAAETLRLMLSQASGASLIEPRKLDVIVLDAQAATVRFVDGAYATVDEQTQDVPVLVELSLPAGVTLAVDLPAPVADTAAGTATPGSDYASFGTRLATFASGSPSGTTTSVTLRVLDDSKVENSESVRLELLAAPGVVPGDLVTYELTITDDDSGGEAFLRVSEGPGGTENTLSHGAALDLGTQAVGAGPNAGTLLRLTNAGQKGLTLGAPELGGDDPDDFALEIESLSAPPPPAPGATLLLGPDLVAPFRGGLDDPRLGLALTLDVQALAPLDALTAATLHGFPLPGQGTVTLALQRLPLPLAPDAVLAIDGTPQPGGLRSALDGVTLWRGSVLERPGSRVFLALGPDGARGFVELPDSADRLVHVLTESALRGEPPRVRVALEGQLAALGRERVAPLCEGLALVPGATPPAIEPGTPGVAALTTPDCRLAIETDWQLTERMGSVQAVTAYVTQLVAAVSDRYLIDVQATLSIAYLGVYSDSNDPWTTPDGPGTTAQMLDEFQGAWSSAGTGVGWPVPATLAHFLSGASLGGGIAYIDVLCNQIFGFGVSAIHGDIDWSTWTGQKGAFTWDFMVVAHELGHNFGTPHTHDYCPPLDQCSSNCNGSTACTEGTIMSYCHLCAGAMNNIRLEFHPVVADKLRTEVNMHCLGDSSLAGGDWVQYLLRFNPLGAPGLRSAELEITHGAPNHPSPFRLQLSGTATD